MLALGLAAFSLPQQDGRDRGDTAVRELIDELSTAGEGHEAPGTITVLPRHTIIVKMTVGKSLPPDVAQAQID